MSDGRSVAARALSILEAFDEEHVMLSLSELARRTAMPLSTVHRLVGDLTAWGALSRHGGRYTVGKRIVELGVLAPQSDFRRAILPHLVHLHTATRHTAHVAVRDDDRLVFVERLASDASVPLLNRVGFPRPMHATAAGKVLLAHSPEHVQARVMANLTRVTPRTIVDAKRLRWELTRTRELGYAVSCEETRLGFCSLAAPVFDRGEVVAAVGLVTQNLLAERRLAATLRDTAARMGQSLAAQTA